MVLNTSAFTGGMFAILKSFLFWIILGIAFIGGALIILVIRRNKKLTIPYIELVDIGRGKLGVTYKGKKNRCGWFRHHTALFGLYDYGYEEVCKTKDKRVILNVSSEDYHDINGRPGLIVQRSPEDPRILVPVTNAVLQNYKLLNTIAPAEYRGTAVDIIKQAEKETEDKTLKVIQYALLGGLIIIVLISIILIIQMVKSGQDKAGELILQAGQMSQENIKTICANYNHAGEVVASTSGAP